MCRRRRSYACSCMVPRPRGMIRRARGSAPPNTELHDDSGPRDDARVELVEIEDLRQDGAAHVEPGIGQKLLHRQGCLLVQADERLSRAQLLLTAPALQLSFSTHSDRCSFTWFTAARAARPRIHRARSC